MPCVIAALRQQIKETKDAVELNNPKLLDTKGQVQAETGHLQNQLQARGKRYGEAALWREGGREGAGERERGREGEREPFEVFEGSRPRSWATVFAVQT